jgi:predicted glutamine amidotransferase
MCLIIVKNKGVNLTEKLDNSIINSFNCNRDGFGYAFKRDKQEIVCFKKGFKNPEEIINSIKEQQLSKNDILVVHARMGTSGKKGEINCHPFIGYPSYSNLIQGTIDIYGSPIIFHNGVISEYYKMGDDKCDTNSFVETVFTDNSENRKLLYSNPETFFKDFENGRHNNTKLAILFSGSLRNIYLNGTFVTDAESGLVFSHGGYCTTLKEKNIISNYINKDEDEDNDNLEENNSKFSTRLPKEYLDEIKEIKLQLEKNKEEEIKNQFKENLNSSKIKEVFENENTLFMSLRGESFHSVNRDYIDSLFKDNYDYSNINVNKNNFRDFLVICIKQDEEKKLNIDYTYSIDTFDENLIILKYITGVTTNNIHVIEKSTFNSQFIIPKPSEYYKYKDCNYFSKILPSKSLLKKLNKFIDIYKNKNNKNEIVNFNIGEIKINITLDMLIYHENKINKLHKNKNQLTIMQ